MGIASKLNVIAFLVGEIVFIIIFVFIVITFIIFIFIATAKDWIIDKFKIRDNDADNR